MQVLPVQDITRGITHVFTASQAPGGTGTDIGWVALVPVGPAWATDTLAFLLSGIGFAVVGVTLIMAWKQAENSDGMSGLADHAPSQWPADDAP